MEFAQAIWNILQSSAPGTPRTYFWGSNTLSDKMVPADYDGDGFTDFAFYRNGTWYIQASTAGLIFQPFGGSGETPVLSAYIP